MVAQIKIASRLRGYLIDILGGPSGARTPNLLIKSAKNGIVRGCAGVGKKTQNLVFPIR
jgi:hypothetical protein